MSASRTLTTICSLPDNVIVLRKQSMVKIAPSSSPRTGQYPTARILVCNTSEKAKRARLNANLLPLIEAGAQRKDQAVEKQHENAEMSDALVSSGSSSHRQHLQAHVLRMQEDQAGLLKQAVSEPWQLTEPCVHQPQDAT